MTKVTELELRLVGLPLKSPFRTSFGVETEKVCVLVRVVTDDAEGWGECVAGLDPGYSEEWNESAWLVIREFLAPALFAAGDVTTDDLDRVLGGVRGNPMAKATVIDAFLDAELRAAKAVPSPSIWEPTRIAWRAAYPSGSRTPPRNCSNAWTATWRTATGASS